MRVPEEIAKDVAAGRLDVLDAAKEINDLVLAEREACAQVLLNGRFLSDESLEKKFANQAAAAIRRRTQ